MYTIRPFLYTLSIPDEHIIHCIYVFVWKYIDVADRIQYFWY